jgi:AcrR family transcriptional regulator
MGTKERKEREKNFRRRQIEEAAKEMFLAKGFRSTTMKDIAKKAELSTGAIYQYFKNKDELYASMNLEGLKSMTSEIESIYKDQHLSYEKKILKIKEAMYGNFLNFPLLLRVVFHVQLEDTLATLDRQLLNQLNALGKKTMNLMASVYEGGVKAGAFRKGHGLAHADIMWGTFVGLLMWEEAKRRINPKKDFLKSTLDRAFEIFCRGIEKDNKGRKSNRENLRKHLSI